MVGGDAEKQSSRQPQQEKPQQEEKHQQTEKPTQEEEQKGKEGIAEHKGVQQQGKPSAGKGKEKMGRGTPKLGVRGAASVGRRLWTGGRHHPLQLLTRTTWRQRMRSLNARQTCPWMPSLRTWSSRRRAMRL